MRDNTDGQRGRILRIPSRRSGALILAALLIPATAGITGLDLLRSHQAREAALRDGLARDLDAARERAADAVRRLANLEAKTLRMERATEERLAAGQIETARLAAEISERQRAEHDEVVGLVSRRFDVLDGRIGRTRPSAETFQDIQARHDRSVVLIYCEFSYHPVEEGRRGPPRRATGWGSGFIVTEEGHIVTNKHVVQPWKFDSDLMALAALGEIEVDEWSVRLAAWPAGERTLDAERNPVFSTGYNNIERQDLRLFALAPDRWGRRSVEFAGGRVGVRLHDLDNNDLAILKAEGAPFHPLPCAEGDGGPGLRKLDPVMALGFPRGQSGLESGIAETSPSIGTVRKVEETIHVSAAIIPGNSGGPLFGADGRVVGVTTRIFSETLGICLKIEHALRLLRHGILAERLAGIAAAGFPLPAFPLLRKDR